MALTLENLALLNEFKKVEENKSVVSQEVANNPEYLETLVSTVYKNLQSLYPKDTGYMVENSLGTPIKIDPNTYVIKIGENWVNREGHGPTKNFDGRYYSLLNERPLIKGKHNKHYNYINKILEKSFQEVQQKLGGVGNKK